MRITIAAFALAAAGCGGSPEPAPAPDASAELARLADIEDARDEDAKELAAAATSAVPEVRARAALVMGRMLRAKHVDKLLTLAADPNAIVRRTAVGSLGQYGWTPFDRRAEVVTKVKPLLDDPEESVRAAAVEAMGKLAEADAPSLVARATGDPSPRVRAEAAMACWRWKRVLSLRQVTELPDLPGDALAGLIALAGERDAGIRWRAAYALLDARAGSVLLGLLKDADATVRYAAARSLRRVKVEGAAEALAALQADPDLAVRVEAVGGVVALNRAELLSVDLAKDPSAHVRAAAADAARADLLEALANDPSPTVRAAVIRGLVKLKKDEAKPQLAAAVVNRDWQVREAAVEAAASLKEAGLSILAIAQDDRSELVRAAVVGAAGAIEGGRAYAIVKRALRSTSLAERGTAIEALGSRKEADASAVAREAFVSCVGHEWIEVRETAVGVVAKDPSPEVTEWLRGVLANDPATAVRRKACAELKKRGVEGLEEPRPEMTHSPHKRLTFASNPVVVLETTRGRLAIECFPKDAPVHVGNFVGLVRAGFYDGLTWHRVVSNFVIQGGDPMGNGWGDAGWSLRAEINGQLYTRGTLGMPRTQDWDTGGCQLFITHVPTPGLDGLYTIFGRVVEGLDVIDAIERGDKILKATVRE